MTNPCLKIPVNVARFFCYKKNMHDENVLCMYMYGRARKLNLMKNYAARNNEWSWGGVGVRWSITLRIVLIIRSVYYKQKRRSIKVLIRQRAYTE